jgi:Lon protease-like protein
MQMYDSSPRKNAHQEIALFPIPDLVAFPGSVVPLHIFEPRYRTMINDCVSNERLIGLCHTKKKISQGRLHQSLDESLQSNQATYQPYEVFSAGSCDVLEVLDDGRIHALVQVTDRYTIVDEIQTLPYRIAICETFEDHTDEPGSVEEAIAEGLQQRINGLLVTLIEHQNPALVGQVDWEKWHSMAPAEFSFRVFDFLRFDADAMQMILEHRSVMGRLKMIWRILHQATNLDQ